MKKELKWFVFFSSFLLLLNTACSDDEESDLFSDWRPKEPVSETTWVNKFIEAYVKEAYLWTSTIDWGTVRLEKEADPFRFFEKLCYKEEDKWSMLTDDRESVMSELQGVTTTFGYQLSIHPYFDAPDYYYAIILYIYPNSPAEKVGLKRGDFIIGKDMGDITITNYMDLYNASSLILQTATYSYESGGLVVNPNGVYIAAESLYEDPVNTYKVIEKGANKIGYLCYTDYVIESESRLQEVFTEFKLQGVTDVVLDLRYNTGGFAQTSCVLSSILAPASAVKGKDIFLSQQWNDAYTAYYKKNKYDTNEYFTDLLTVNMDSNRLFVLTSGYTASASEATIIGLKPYMDVVLIGDTTYGKYCGASLYSPKVWDKKKKEWLLVEEIENWGLYLTIYRFANKEGFTSFTGGGLLPDIAVEEDYLDLYPFGDERDPLLAKAISRITGEPVVKARSATSAPTFKILNAIRPMKAFDGKMIDTRPLPKLNE